MSEPSIEELLAPLTAPDSEAPPRRLPVNRDRIVSRMVEASLRPEPRFSARAKLGAALAVAAMVALALGAGLSLRDRGDSVASSEVRVRARTGDVRVDGRALPLGQDLEVARDGVLQTGKDASARIEADGMEVELLGNSSVSLGSLGVSKTDAAVRLQRGRVRCVIPHQPGRVFSVVTDDARVIDVGTVFSVTVVPSDSGSKTSVQVEEGEVLVEHAGRQHRLRAPASWTSVPEAAPSTVDSLPIETNEPATPNGPRRDAGKRPRETLAAEIQLLQSGLASEQRGDLVSAARSFEQLAKRFPASPLAPDARAALARVKGRMESSK